VALRSSCGDVSAHGSVKIVARPERVRLLEHGARAENCMPGMVERTVYVGSSLQVIVQLAAGGTVQASVANSGAQSTYSHGTPVAVQVPAEALRVLATTTLPSPSHVDGDEATASAAPAPAVASALRP
jgi:ABC-type Fe3+/spermidine/putrescine transport system ATPase subunit